jgi:hypothetical protein
MKQMHRLMVTSSAYRMVSTRDDADAAKDPDNIYLWRTPSRRMEAELVRDNLLYVAGNLDPGMGGPEIDHKLGLSSRRRSVYLRTAAEKEVEFLKLFDNASVMECYMRKPSVMPQQALALANSELAIAQAQALSDKLWRECNGDTDSFIACAFERILARAPKLEEARYCREFLGGSRLQEAKTKAVQVIPVSTAKPLPRASEEKGKRARDLVLVLFNHNDFVTIR